MPIRLYKYDEQKIEKHNETKESDHPTAPRPTNKPALWGSSVSSPLGCEVLIAISQVLTAAMWSAIWELLCL